MDHFIGNWWSANDSDVIPAGDGAKGYKGATFHAPGTNFKVQPEIVKTSTTRARAPARRKQMGAVLYNRGMVNAMLTVEAIRTAHGQVRQQAADRRAGALGLREPEPRPTSGWRSSA